MKCAFSAYWGSQSVATLRISLLSKYVRLSMHDNTFMYLVLDNLKTCNQNVQFQINFQVNYIFNQSKVFLLDVCKFGYIKNQDYLHWKQYFQYLGVTVI